MLRVGSEFPEEEIFLEILSIAHEAMVFCCSGRNAIPWNHSVSNAPLFMEIFVSCLEIYLSVVCCLAF